MANLYSFVSRKSIAPTAESVFNAEKVSNVADYKAVAKKAGEFIFNTENADAKLIQSVFADLVSVRFWSEKNADGIVFTKGEATDKDGCILPFRCYGKKGEIVQERTLTGENLSKLVWGVCVQDGETITETKHSNGPCKKFPVAYLRIA